MNYRAIAPTGRRALLLQSFQWNWRLLLATGRARYAEAMERVLWNTIAGAVSRHGTEFFYSNTLHLRTGHDGADEELSKPSPQLVRVFLLPTEPGPPHGEHPGLLVTAMPLGCKCTCPSAGQLPLASQGGPWGLRACRPVILERDTDIEVTHCSSAERWDLSLRFPDWAGKAHE